MHQLIKMSCAVQQCLNRTRLIDFLAPLTLRLYLAPVFWVAGMNKFNHFEDTVGWFEYSLGLPLPWLMAALATSAEVLGAVLLFFGIAVRWISIPLMVTMLVAIFIVHIENGWQAVTDLSSPFPNASAGEALERLDRAKQILQEYGHYEWLTEHGNFVVSNNGIEWAVTYLLMLLVLFFIGGGRWVSVDYWLCRWAASRSD